MVRASVEDLLKGAGLVEFVQHFTSAAESILAVGGNAAMRKRCTDITGKQSSLQLTMRSYLAAGQEDSSAKVAPRAGEPHVPRAHLTQLARVDPTHSGAAFISTSGWE
jgi:hypothetical protein